jgi:hypothetical protein
LINKYNSEAGAIKDEFEMKKAELDYQNQQRQQQMSEM